MEIEVGEYVRFEDGKIERVTYQLKEFIDEHISKSENNRVEFLGKIKHSKNIIELIEVGDIVNGMEILHIEDNKLYVEWNNEFEEFTGFLENKDIKTILTKESYMANCYKVGGEDEKI